MEMWWELSNILDASVIITSGLLHIDVEREPWEYKILLATEYEAEY